MYTEHCMPDTDLNILNTLNYFKSSHKSYEVYCSSFSRFIDEETDKRLRNLPQGKTAGKW